MIPSKDFSKKVVQRTSFYAVIIFLVLILFEFNYHCFTDRHALAFSILTGLLTGIISAIILLYFQERLYENNINLYYSNIAGHYKRIDIGQDNSPDSDLENMKKQNKNLDILLKHVKGTHSFECIADYWEDANAKVKATIEFNERNGTTAFGRYRYIAGTGYDEKQGTYKIYRMEEDKTKLLVLYHHLFPRTNQDNPDKNRGWEVWQKQ